MQVIHRGWDHHGSNDSDDLIHGLPKMCRQTDQAAAALVTDLRQRGMLDDTLVVWGGEFGRTPMREVRKQSHLGRDHNPRAWTMWFAGGGVKNGQTIGGTDELGYRAAEDPVHLHDVHATILHLMGIDHERLTHRFQGRDYRLTDVHGKVVRRAARVSPAPAVAVVEVAFGRSPCQLRMPFRFGGVTLQRADSLTCRVTIRGADGAVARGWSADLLAPRWFRKDNDATPAAGRRRAAGICRRQPRGPWSVSPPRPRSSCGEASWRRASTRSRATRETSWCGASASRSSSARCSTLFVGWSGRRSRKRCAKTPLVSGRPTCTRRSRDGIGGGTCRRCAPRVAVRHTVGMLDPLRDRDLSAEQRLGDGLPQTLEGDLDAYGGRWLKVKIGAGVDGDRARLLDLARFCDERGGALGFSLDGNEQYDDLAQVADLLDGVAAEPQALGS